MISAICGTSPNPVKVPSPWMEMHLLCSLLCSGSNALLHSLVHWPTAANCFVMSIQPMANCDSFVATPEKCFVRKKQKTAQWPLLQHVEPCQEPSATPRFAQNVDVSVSPARLPLPRWLNLKNLAIRE